MRRGLLGAAVALLLLAAPARAAVHPQAAEQPTLRGKTIHSLAYYDGKVYSGYGDYGQNTGPIALNPYDPASGSFLGVESVLRTEEVGALRVLGGKLYAPYTDAEGGSVGTPDYWVNGTEVDGFVGGHTFDMAIGPNGGLWAVGAAPPDDGMVWWLPSGASAWQESLRIPQPSPGNFVRIYFVGIADGKVYAQPTPAFATGMPGYVWDGQWRQIPSLGYQPWHGEQFNGELVYQRDDDCCLSTLDGIVRAGTEDYAKDSGTVYSLEGRRIYASADLVHWTSVERTPLDAVSITAKAGDLWCGTQNSEVIPC